jgi:hypothetical protein
MKTSSVLKTLAVALLLGGGSLFTTGCSHSGLEYDFLAPPAYSSSENSARIWRYAAFDWNQAIEDFDRDVTMTRPGSRMTMWDIRHSD